MLAGFTFLVGLCLGFLIGVIIMTPDEPPAEQAPVKPEPGPTGPNSPMYRLAKGKMKVVKS